MSTARNSGAGSAPRRSHTKLDHRGIRFTPLRADKTNPAPEVDETLRRLGNEAASIPYYAIFPSNSSSKPNLLDGLLTSPEPIVQAVRRAGPSRGAKISHRAIDNRANAGGLVQEARHYAFGPRSFVAGHDIS
jgi:hypothetical protein